MAAPKKRPPVKGPGSDDVFEYTTLAGDTISVPSLAGMPAGVIRRTRKLSVADQLFTAIEEMVSPEALAVIDGLLASEFNAFSEAWAEFSGTSMGESSAS